MSVSNSFNCGKGADLGHIYPKRYVLRVPSPRVKRPLLPLAPTFPPLPFLATPPALGRPLWRPPSNAPFAFSLWNANMARQTKNTLFTIGTSIPMATRLDIL